MMKGFRQRVLSRAKDGNKLAKNKKDNNSGAASPNVGASQSPAGSAHATPTSSTSNLVDPRNKPLPNETQTASQASTAQTVQPGANTALNQGHFQPHSIGMAPVSGTNQGAVTPGRHGQPMPPSVVISPSAPHIPPPGAAETMPHDLAPPKAGQKSLLFDRLQTTPKDTVPEGIRTPKRQHSSRFDISDQRQRELEKLPGFHEVPPNRR